MIAITGATGFIGKYLSDKISHPQKRLSRTTIPNKDFPHVWMQGDLSHSTPLKNFVNDSPVLLHLACSTHPRSSNLNFKDDLHSNLISTIHLFETYAKENPDGHIIFSSSGGNMYPAFSPTHFHTEEDLPVPQSSYAIHKLAAENYLRLICEKYGIKGTVLRISNPYGIILPKERAQGLIGVAFAKLISNELLQIFDSLESMRDYIHLEDVASAFNLAMDHPPQRGECRLFNVSSGKGHSLKEVLHCIEKASELSILKKMDLSLLPKPTYSLLSSLKIQNMLGWQPKFDLDEGIQTMWNDSITTQSVIKK